MVSWDEREVDVPEGGNREVCFSSDIGTVQSYNVMVGARQKGANPATRGMYMYTNLICVMYVGRNTLVKMNLIRDKISEYEFT